MRGRPADHCAGHFLPNSFASAGLSPRRPPPAEVRRRRLGETAADADRTRTGRGARDGFSASRRGPDGGRGIPPWPSPLPPHPTMLPSSRSAKEW
eukprot:gene14911-biopygen17139